MKVVLALSALLFSQAAIAGVDGSVMQERDAAYTQLANGETQAAITRLQAALTDHPDDPALLINLGSAYAAIGETDRARSYYNAAAQSDIRYRLELANGEWIDSRRASRMAMRALEGRNFEDLNFALN